MTMSCRACMLLGKTLQHEESWNAEEDEVIVARKNAVDNNGLKGVGRRGAAWGDVGRGQKKGGKEGRKIEKNCR